MTNVSLSSRKNFCVTFAKVLIYTFTDFFTINRQRGLGNERTNESEVENRIGFVQQLKLVASKT